MDINRRMPTVAPVKVWHNMVVLVAALAAMLIAGCASATYTPAKPTLEAFANLAPCTVSVLSPSEE